MTYQPHQSEDVTTKPVACATERECEWMPWCRMHANCRRKVLDDRTAKHVARAVGVSAGSAGESQKGDAT